MLSSNQSWSSSRASSTSSPKSSRASSIDDQSPSDGADAMDVFQSIYNGRKSWKTLRGGEMVWPAELEAALIEGLEKYTPDDSRETRLLGRFPMRNRFISEYIYRKTGRKRTAKQVGSRLQQLRETCSGKRLMDLLSPCRRQIPPSLNRAAFSSEQCDSASSNGSGSVPLTPTDEVAPYSFSRAKHDTTRIFRIDILPLDVGHPYFPLEAPAAPRAASLENATRLSDHARHIRTIDPTLTFMSQSRISAESHFVVYSEDSPVFKETIPLSLCETNSQSSPSGTEGCLLYKTSLVPTYWKTISQSSDPTKYMILQDIVQAGHTLYSAKYTFTYPGQYAAPITSHTSALPDSPFEFSFEDLQSCFGTDASAQEYQKANHAYNFPPFDNSAWVPHVAVRRTSGERAVHLLPGQSQTFDVESSPGSISPMSATFPSNYADSMNRAFQGNFNMM